jgi:signal transduction histidine kinase
LRGRPWSWITGRPQLIDALIVVFNFAAGALSLLGTFYRASVIAAVLFLVLVQASVLFWRRTQPLAVLLVVVVTMIVAFAIAPDREPSSPALAFAVYAVSVYGRGRARLFVVGTAIVMVIGAVALLLLNDFNTSRKLLPAGVITLIVWVIGDYIRSRRQFFQDLVARHKQERDQAAEEERLRIARELHDVVAHNVSAMAIQAGAARVSGSSGAEALESIEQGARDTLAELNRLLGVLRKSPTASAVPGAPLAPQPTLDEADALLKPARDAGLEATLKVTGQKRPLPAAIDLSAYRIVQEAITNVLKHANASRVEVVIDYQSEGVTLTISDNGTGPGETPSTGHGLIGMRERVALFGGEMDTGSTPLGGFTVHARLPYKN